MMGVAIAAVTLVCDALRASHTSSCKLPASLGKSSDIAAALTAALTAHGASPQLVADAAAALALLASSPTTRVTA